MPRLALSILLVQHMPLYINERLRNSLDAVTGMNVLIAEDGMKIEPGQLLIAPSEQHMMVERNQVVKLVTAPPVCHVCPAVDVLMQSFTRIPRVELTGVILTGMGKDGADGVVHLTSLGAKTMAQDKESSAVFGMPRRAIETGVVDFVGRPKQIADKIRKLAGPLPCTRAAS